MKIWIYVEGRQQGPFSMEELLDKPVDENTKVWFEGLPKWYPAGYLDEMKPLFDGSLARSLAEKAEAPENTGDETCDKVDETSEDEAPVEEAVTETEVVVEQPEVVQESKYAPGRRFRRSELPDEPCPPTHLGWTIFLTVCCCSPVSVAGLIASICVSSFYSSGNVEKARKASEWAAWLIMISLALGLIPVMLMGMLFGNGN